jgi:hypothetical protein
MSTLLSKILNYEEKLNKKYLQKRKCLLEHIKTIEINKLSDVNLSIFINDLKVVFDSIESTSDGIDFLISNKFFKKKDSIIENDFLSLYLLLRLTSTELSEEELTEVSLSDSSLSEVSLSDSSLSEVSVSVSVSVSDSV